MEKDFAAWAELLTPGKKLYFIGIGGVSMSGLALLAASGGALVSGSDLAEKAYLEPLHARKIPVYIPQQAANIDAAQPDAVIYSAAIHSEHPERRRARELGIPELSRSEWLGVVNRSFPQVVNVAGTNGKSTTTAMLSAILLEAGRDPTVHLGAEFAALQGTVHVGSRDLMVSEACEFNYSFLDFASSMAAVLNLDHDHVDIFPEMEDVIAAFARFVGKLQAGATLVLPNFDPYMPRLEATVRAQFPGLWESLRIRRFGYAGAALRERWQTMPGADTELQPAEVPADLRIEKLHTANGLPVFDLVWRTPAGSPAEQTDGSERVSVALRIPAQFNAENAAAAALLASELGVAPAAIAASLSRFYGVEGRFTRIGQYHGADIIEDYAHHPDSVRLTLEAAENLPHRRLFAAFQPITYSRARGLFREFAAALTGPFQALLVEVFDDREVDRSFSSARIAEAVRERGGEASFYESPETLEAFLREELQEGDLVVLMGQNVRAVGDRLTGRQLHKKLRCGARPQLSV